MCAACFTKSSKSSKGGGWRQRRIAEIETSINSIGGGKVVKVVKSSKRIADTERAVSLRRKRFPHLWKGVPGVR